MAGVRSHDPVKTSSCHQISVPVEPGVVSWTRKVHVPVPFLPINDDRGVRGETVGVKLPANV